MNELTNNLSAAQKRRLMKQVRAQLKQKSTKTKERQDAEIERRQGDRSWAVLSFSQQRLWFLDKLEGTSASYNIPAAFKLSGPLDIGALELAFNQLISRHESLRTYFDDIDGQPRQCIVPELTIELTAQCLSTLIPSSGSTMTAIEQAAEEHALTPISIDEAPLLRVKLWRIEPDQHLLLYTLHHIIADGWSSGIFLAELNGFYLANVNRTPPPFAPLSIHYSDFAHWQREHIKDERLESQLDYWRQKLADLPAILTMPTDRARPAIQSFAGDCCEFGISQSLTEQLSQLSKANSTTLFVTLLAGFKLLLSRFAGQRDIALGTPVANRTHSVLEPLIGCFINTLVLRTTVDEDLSFVELLRQVKSTSIEAFSHQDIPFEMLVDKLQPERSMSHTPLFQVMFVLQNAKGGQSQADAMQNAPEPAVSGLQMTALAEKSQLSKYDLTLTFSQTPHGLFGTMEYSTALFDKTTIERILGHYHRLLTAVVETPERPMIQLHTLSEQEISLQLNEWEQTQQQFEPLLSPVEAFSFHAQTSPEALALTIFDQNQQSHSYTYQQIDSRANQLAHYLIAQGVGANTLVGLCVKRGPDMIIGLLAILKSGGAYVPLDPSFPPSRLAHMIEDSGLQILLTHADVQPMLPVVGVFEPQHQRHRDSQLVCLDTQWSSKIACYDTDSPDISMLPPERLVYVIYTSGSTGKPKGVAVELPALANFIVAMNERITLTNDCRWLALTTIAFDICALEIYGPLSVGGQIVLASSAEVNDGKRLNQIIDTQQINYLQATPATWNMLLTNGWQGQQELTALCGGEALSSALLQALLPRCGRLFNCYGPTEATVWSLVKEIESNAPIEQQLSLANGLANLRHLVLGPNLQLLPIGVAGELHIGGKGLAQGYFNQPQLSAKVFIDNPFSEIEGSRLYKTGDKVRWLANGQLAFLGRIDNQVKLRGFRIELGEIETHLHAVDGVKENTVVIWVDDSDNKHLVAYVVVEPQQAFSAKQAREQLLLKVPDYMVPTLWVELEQLPLTPNGKVDRKNLPSPTSNLQPNKEFVAPQTPLQHQLSAIWLELLAIEKVSIDDNFFTVGGHSILAIQLLARIKQQFEFDMALQQLFQMPTIAEMALYISQHAKPVDGQPLSLAQQRIWMLQQLDENSGCFNHCISLHLSGHLQLPLLQQALDSVLDTHQSLRSHFVSHDANVEQLVATSAPLTIVYESLNDSENIAELLSQRHQDLARRSFDLQRPPLVAVELVGYGDQQYQLSLCAHQLIVDKQSMEILVEQLGNAYSTLAHGLALVPETANEYHQYVQLQQQWLDSSDYGIQGDYWLSQLQELPSLLSLPTPHGRPVLQSFSAKQILWSIPDDLQQKLQVLAQRLNVKFATVMLGAFKLLIHHYSANSEVVVATTTANRQLWGDDSSQSGFEQTLGLFANPLILRSQINLNDSFAQLLLTLQALWYEGIDHQPMPFECLLNELKPQRDLDHNPLYQLGFECFTQPSLKTAFEPLNAQPAPTIAADSMTDLTLLVEQHNQGWQFGMLYCEALFTPQVIENMLGHYLHILTLAVDDSDRMLSQLSLLDLDQSKQVLQQFNGKPVAENYEQTLHQQFAQYAQTHPQRPAVAIDNQTLNYQQLNQRANQVAHYLIEQGLVLEQFVGVCAYPSIELAVGVLGVLKAGGVYVPLDPSLPMSRLEYIIEDTQMEHLIVQTAEASRLASFEGQQLLINSEGLSEQTPSNQDNPQRFVDAENLAYMVYTSGSTGKPKGVMVSHNRVNLIVKANALKTDVQLRGSFNAPFGFDVAVWEMFNILTRGGLLHFCHRQQITDARLFAEFLFEAQINVAYIPPGLLSHVIHHWHNNGQMPQLQQILVGVESITQPTLQQYRDMMPRLKITNAYGPSETTIFCTQFDFEQTDERYDITPIGRAIDGYKVYVLDQYLHPVAPGVAGMLYVGGLGLSRGYLGRPDLTAEMFVPNPFASESGALMYHTGDLVRYSHDGQLIFIGRKDNQTKIRGYRIELGEIEAVIGQYPQVLRQLALIDTDDNDNKRLVVYVVAEQGVSLERNQLRDFLKQKLPAYMVPDFIIQIDGFALTANGKLDVSQLPKVDFSEQLMATYQSPQTPQQQILADIWAEVLDLPQVGINDNFFDIGGQSLLANQMIYTLEQLQGIVVPVRLLFECPTIKQLAPYLADDSTLLRTENLPLVAIDRSGPLPLSFAQQRLWFLDQLEQDNIAYNLPSALRLKGKLDPQALEQAFKEIFNRHESLRTRFIQVEGEARQVVSDDMSLPWQMVDLQADEQGSFEQAISDAMRDEAQTPFNLETDSLLRVKLLRVSENDHLLLFTMHHIVSDGWSMGVVVQEMSSLYGAFVQGQESPLSDLPIQYGDFAHWQRSRIQGEVLQRQIDYWKHQLADMPPLLELPYDRPRPPVQSHTGGSCSFGIPSALVEQLNQLAAKHNATLYMVLLAGFKLMLARFSNQHDFAVGTPIANRTRTEVEPMIGFFVNTLVLRCRLYPTMTLSQLIDEVKETCLGAFGHQDIPFEQLFDDIQPQRNLSHSALFQVMFVLQNNKAGTLELPGLEFQPLGQEVSVAKFDLTITMTEHPQGLFGAMEFATALFDRETVERMLDYYHLLLEVMVSDCELTIKDCPWMSAPQQQQLLSMGQNLVDYPLATSIAQMISAQAQMCPDSIALVDEQQQLSYAQLERDANQLANYLVKKGIKIQQRIGICMSRRCELVTAIVAVLKLGGIYVPLDPKYPSSRLQHLLSDSAVSLILTDPNVTLTVEHDIQTVCFEQDATAIRACESCFEDAVFDSQMIAYIIYTSGSTGLPKGVMVSHQSVINHNRYAIERYGIDAKDRVLQFSSYSFDISVEEIFPTLMCGATLVMYPDSRGVAIEVFEQFVAEQQLSVVNLPTAFWRLWSGLLSQNSKTALAGLKTVIVGGEQSNAPQLKHWQQQLGDKINWFNTYGPTECTVIASVLEPPKGQWHYTHALPIGKPTANTQLYVLDEQMQPVLTGVAGQLYIGGLGLAHGYWQQPEQTAATFVPNPFAKDPGQRLYCSGDRVRWLNNGELEFLGRVDHQVKVRGFRVEPGEIEAVVVQHPLVRQSRVLAFDDVQGNKQLVAYVVRYVNDDEQQAEQMTAINEWLAQQLPSHMVPASLIFIEQMPLTTNGKLDRNALPKADINAQIEQGYVAPRTPQEMVLTQIWADVLGLQRVGIFDNFFAIGGHSLLATQLVARIAQVEEIELPVRALFEAPTIAALAQQLDSSLGQSHRNTLPLISVSRTQVHPLSFAQQRLWFLFQLEGPSSTYNMPTALRLKGRLNVTAMAQSLTELIHRHEVLRTRFVLVDEQPSQQIAAPQPIQLEPVVVDSIAQMQEQVLNEATKPFTSLDDDLIRCGLLRLADDDWVLLLTVHHIISDGWSVGVMMNELGQLYRAFCQQKPSPLPPLAIQYVDFSHWQRQWLQGDNLQKQMDYWQQQLQQLPPLLPLPYDHSRPPAMDFSGATVDFALSANIQRQLQDFSRAQGTTMFMTLMAVFKLLLARYSGQNDIAVGTPVANRTRSELEPLIGFFVNTLVLRDTVDQNQSFKQLLDEVKHTALAAYGHQDIPFEQLVEVLNPQRSMAHSPLFQVMLVMQNFVQASQNQNSPPQGTASNNTEQHFYDLTLIGIDEGAEQQNSKGTVAKFDLTLSLSETEQGLIGSFEYATALFEQETIERMSEHFALLVEGLLAQPSQPMWQVPMLSVQTQRPQACKPIELTYPQPHCFDLLFERQAQLTPLVPALIWQQQSVSYQALNHRVNQLANYLLDCGIGRGDIVALYFDRGIEVVIAILAVLKAGGAYLPLDSQQSEVRLGHMLSNCQPKLLLSQQQNKSLLIGNSTKTLIWNAEFETQLDRYEHTNPVVERSGNDLAYLLYTSGSTGLPKGVMISHQSVMNLFAGLADILVQGNYPTQCRWAWNAAIGFDASVQGLLQLACGGSLYILPQQLRSEPQQLLTYLTEHQIDILDATPSQIEVLLSVVDSKDIRCGLIIGGDAISEPLWQQVAALFSDRAQWAINVYGPTECTVNSTFELITPDTKPAIGQPLINVDCYILDEYLNPTPDGVVGQLYLAGAGLAYGYYGQGDLTASAFMPDPFSPLGSRRMYQTGDLVRRCKNGHLVFVGRNDHQVKVRGFRIELNEVNSVLIAHNLVVESVVIAMSLGETDDLQLVAYVVTHESVAIDEIKQWLSHRLPQYMVPNIVVMLDNMPLNANGKIDRKALPRPDISGQIGATYVAPESEQEQVLADIWAETLGLERVGCHDNFFDIGGHSLLATKVIAKITQSFGVELPVRVIFETPTISGLAKQVLIAQNQNNDAIPALVAVSRNEPLPLSFAQQRLWFLDQLEGASATYNMPMALQLDGELNIDFLTASFEHLCSRHESLRTRFVSESLNDEQQVQQVIDDFKPFDIPVITVSSLAEAQQLANSDAIEPFDLQNGPLFRFRLLRINAQQHVLLLNLHHIISDGWSTGVMLSELTGCYNALLAGETYKLPNLIVQYGDFSHWQRQWLQGEVIEQQLNYWRQKLADMPQLLPLPTDRPYPPVMDFSGETLNFGLSLTLQTQLAQYSRKHGTTSFTTALAVFKLLLARYSGQNDIAVGTVVANRTRTELEPLIGFFVNTLVLRDKVDQQLNFAQLLAEVKDTCLDAYSHQDIPFEQLVDLVNPERSLSHTPLFQVVFSFNKQSAESSGTTFNQLQCVPLGQQTQVAKFTLTMTLSESENGLLGSLQYASALFDHSTIERMADHFGQLLTAVLASDNQPLSSIDMLSTSERKRLLDDWQGDLEACEPWPCIHQKIEHFALTRADSLAVAYQGEAITYGQLNAKANQMAHWLLAQEITIEQRVGVCCEPCVDMVVAMLAILKAGAVYVPLDAQLPQSRLEYIVKDSEMAAVFCSTTCTAVIGDFSLNTFVFGQPLDLWPQQIPQVAVSPLNLAYIIYTSGSTGKPKGVMIEHHRANVQMRGFAAASSMTEPPVASYNCPFGFDVSIWSLLLSLTHGGQLHICPVNYLLEPQEFAAYLKQNQINCAYIPVGLLEPLISHWEQHQNLPKLQRIMVGVESIAQALLQRLMALLPELIISNSYGPTETTIIATVYRFGSSQFAGDITPIGQPIPGYQCYVLDEYMQPVATGVTGQLYIGGDALARGYLNNHQQTADVFVPDPFSQVPGARLYASGDLVYWCPQGLLHFVGRADYQVKIRGFRVELGELEAQLAAHPIVKEQVAMVFKDAIGQQQLVAYVVSNTKQPDDSDILKEYLSTQLPAHMCPAMIMILEVMPLNANGKIDRKALPRPDNSLLTQSEYVAGRNEEEILLADIWAEVLQLERVSIDDNFFELGGHSLLAVRVMARVSALTAVQLPVRLIFAAPTVRQLAKHLVEAMTKPYRNVNPIEAVDRTQPLPLSFAQQRLWFLDKLEGPSATYNMSATLRFEGPLNTEGLSYSIDQLLRRHESLRTRFYQQDEQPWQLIDEPIDISLTALPVADMSQLMEQLNEQASQPFDLAEGPLFIARLWQLSADDHVLLLSMHHIVSDGWSMQVILAQLLGLYHSYVEELPNPLPPMPIQYADYAHWQRQWLQGDELNRQLEYWQNQLAGLSPLLPLPTDRVRPAKMDFEGGNVSFAIEPQLLTSLQNLSREHGTTLFMTLLAAFKVLLARYSSLQDIAVGSVVANRTREELESLIGFFVNTLVFRSQVDLSESFSVLLAKVKTTCLDAYSHQELPFEQIVDALKPERSLSYNPLFQVLMVLQEDDGQHSEREPLTSGLGELKLSSVGGGADAVAKFDLTLNLSSSGDTMLGSLQYRTALFDSQTIERMAEHWVLLLQSLVKDQQQPLDKLSLLPEQSLQNILAQGQPDQHMALPTQSLVQIIEAKALQCPDAIALVHQAEQISYHQFNAKANILAAKLVALGVGPEVRVGLCCERNTQLYIAILAIWKATGVYVPLDPANPDSRMDFIAGDAQIKLWLSDVSNGSRFDQATTVIIEDQLNQVNLDDAPVFVSNTKVAHLAYMIYTSGTTGTPKGTLLGHLGLANLALAQSSRFEVDSKSRVLQFAAIGFDASISEMAMTLCRGATLVSAAASQMSLGVELLRTISRQNITHLTMVPSALAVLSDLRLIKSVKGAECLTHLITAGERCDPRLIEFWGNRLSMFNAYGPTETTVCATMGQVESTCPANIGQALENGHVYVLDSQFNPVPPLVVGQLCIAGAGLAWGYHGRADLSAEKFVPNPFATTAGERLYQSGDLVRWLNDGTLEFIGRDDSQLKIRGFRIEPAEVEVVLNGIEGVDDSVVLGVDDHQGDKQLVAYVCAKSPLDSAGLKAQLAQLLAAYLVPQHIIFLDSMPLTINSKIDISALPKPDIMAAFEHQYVAPRDEQEQLMADIWAGVLGVSRVGIDDDFFAIGGHSLLAVKLIGRICKQWEIELPLAILFSKPTVSLLMAHIITLSEPCEQQEPSDTVVLLNEHHHGRPLFIVHPIGGDVFCYGRLVTQLWLERPVYGLRRPEVANKEAPRFISIAALASHYINEIKKRQSHGPYFIAGWSLGGAIAHEIGVQLEAQGEHVAFVGMIDSIFFEPKVARAIYKRMKIKAEDIANTDINVLVDKVENVKGLRRYFDLDAANLEQLDADERLFYTKLQIANLLALSLHRVENQVNTISYFCAEAEIANDKDLKYRLIQLQPASKRKVMTYRIEGDHYNIVEGDKVAGLAEQLIEVLEGLAF